MTPEINIYKNDLPAGLAFGDSIAIDCEMLGLNLTRDRLCVVQMYDPGQNRVDIVQFTDRDYAAPNLKAVLADPRRLFIGHMIRLDLGWIYKYLGVLPTRVYCTRTASRIAQTFGASHDFKNLVTGLLGIAIDKSETTSDWGAETLSPAQIRYVVNDVIHLHDLQRVLDSALVLHGRDHLMAEIMKTLPARTLMDAAGWWGEDILDFPFPR